MVAESKGEGGGAGGAAEGGGKKAKKAKKARHVVVIGGGLVGASVAYYLRQLMRREKDLRITIVECHQQADPLLAIGASSGNAEGVMEKSACDGTPLEPLARQGFDLHAELGEKWADQTWYRRIGEVRHSNMVGSSFGSEQPVYEAAVAATASRCYCAVCYPRCPHAAAETANTALFPHPAGSNCCPACERQRAAECPASPSYCEHCLKQKVDSVEEPPCAQTDRPGCRAPKPAQVEPQLLARTLVGEAAAAVLSGTEVVGVTMDDALPPRVQAVQLRMAETTELGAWSEPEPEPEPEPQSEASFEPADLSASEGGEGQGEGDGEPENLRLYRDLVALSEGAAAEHADELARCVATESDLPCTDVVVAMGPWSSAASQWFDGQGLSLPLEVQLGASLVAKPDAEAVLDAEELLGIAVGLVAPKQPVRDDASEAGQGEADRSEVNEARRVAERVEYPVVEGVGEAGLTSLVTSGAARDIVLPPLLPLPPGQHQVNRHFACEFIPVRATLFCVRSCTLVCTG